MIIFLFVCYYFVLINNSVAENEAPTKVIRSAKDNITLVAILPHIPIILATEICNNVGGEITTRMFANIAFDFFRTLHPAYEKFWLGASFTNGTWLWNDGTHVKLKKFSPTNGTQDGKECLIYNRLLDKVEEADCLNTYSTVCDDGGGINLGKLLLVLIRKSVVPLRQTRLLFVVDNDVTMGMKYQSTLEFIKNLANTVVLNQNRSFGIEWYSSGASIINFGKNSSNCLVRTDLDELFTSKLSATHTLAIYYNAFKTVNKELAKSHTKDNTLFLFFFAMRQDSGSVEERNNLVKKLKRMGVQIIVIALGDEIIRSSLEEIPSTINDQLQLYSFDTIENYHEASRYLRTKRKFSWNDCSKVGHRRLSLNMPAKFLGCF